MDTGTLYATFTSPKVVTSMLLAGIGLGLALSVLMRLFLGQWYFPFLFAALALGAAILYMAWLDRQDFRAGLADGPWTVPVEGGDQKPVLVRPDCPVVIAGSPARFALFSDTGVIRSMAALSIGLGLVLCLLILFFRGTWFLPALIAAVTIGTVVAYLCWLDGREPGGD